MFSHLNDDGNVHMVDISNKKITYRTAIARGKIILNKKIIKMILNKKIKKGDIFSTARIAGIMGIKNTSLVIPMSHQLLINSSEINFFINEKDYSISSECIVKSEYKTGVEMEALFGVSVSLLTIYDMCKSESKELEIKNIYLYKKSGGKSGIYKNIKKGEKNKNENIRY